MSPDNAPWPYPRWVAHRGAGKLAPENTLAAFRLGAANGYRAFECDVKLSADGVPFLMHDATLERTTTGAGTGGDLPWAALSQLDAGAWHSRQYAGEPLPTLAGIAAWIQANGLQLNIEIKPTPGFEAVTGQVVAEHAARLWAGQAVQPLLSSFKPESLRAAHAAAPHLPRALLIDNLHPGWFDEAMQLGCAAIVTHHRLMDAALLTQAHQAGWRALVYTVNEVEDAQRLLALGIDGIITDAVDRFAPATG
jgi:glycerophosphoryl diester phosphodiesterase